MASYLLYMPVSIYNEQSSNLKDGSEQEGMGGEGMRNALQAWYHLYTKTFLKYLCNLQKQCNTLKCNASCFDSAYPKISETRGGHRGTHFHLIVTQSSAMIFKHLGA